MDSWMILPVILGVGPPYDKRSYYGLYPHETIQQVVRLQTARAGLAGGCPSTARVRKSISNGFSLSPLLQQPRAP
jgi:hypothetical protein